MRARERERETGRIIHKHDYGEKEKIIHTLDQRERERERERERRGQ